MNPLLRAHETILKKKRRGWFLDPHPGLKDLKGKFDAAARFAGEKKLAHVYRREDVKEAAINYVLNKFSLLGGGKGDVDEFTRIVKGDDFGYTKRRAAPAARARDEKPVWGPKAGLGAGWTADRVGAISNESYGGV